VLVRLFQDCQLRSPEERPTFSHINAVLTDFYYTKEINLKLSEEIAKRDELEKLVENLEQQNTEKVSLSNLTCVESIRRKE
jgi:hypothetical protein